jgi:hypothetical protein
MKSKEFFTVKLEAQDLSILVKDYNKDSANLPLQAGEYMYVGYYKPFRQFYVHFDVNNTEANTLTFEYYDGSNWVEVPAIIDESLNFKRSGFIYFDRPESWVKNIVENDENFYIRISSDVSLTPATSLKGLNILLSDDSDLEAIRSTIVTKLNNGESWVEKHEAARKYIVQTLRNLGHRKVKDRLNDSNSGLFFTDEEKDNRYYSNLTQFDLIEPFELREASKYYALSLIYLEELSDEEDDKYFRMGRRHELKADEMLNLFSIKIDTDDDGVEDLDESDGFTGTGLVWR